MFGIGCEKIKTQVEFYLLLFVSPLGRVTFYNSHGDIAIKTESKGLKKMLRLTPEHEVRVNHPLGAPITQIFILSQVKLS